MLRQKLRQNSYQFSCPYSQRFSEASAWAVYHLGEWDDVYQHRPPWVEANLRNKTNGVLHPAKMARFPPPRKDLLPFPPILRSIHDAWSPNLADTKLDNFRFLGLLVGQCRILRHPHRLEDTQFNKVSQLNQNHKDPTKVKHHEECSLVQRVDIPCIFNHIHGQTVARMNLAWTFHCWHFERHTHITIALEQLLHRKGHGLCMVSNIYHLAFSALMSCCRPWLQGVFFLSKMTWLLWLWQQFQIDHWVKPRETFTKHPGKNKLHLFLTIYWISMEFCLVKLDSLLSPYKQIHTWWRMVKV